MKKVLLIVSLLTLPLYAYSQSNRLEYDNFNLNPGWGVRFTDDKAAFYGDGDIEIDCKISVENKLQFIEFFGNPPGIWGFKSNQEYQKQLWLTYDPDMGPAMIFGTYTSDNAMPELLLPGTKHGGDFIHGSAESSSRYAEADKTYYAKNILDIRTYHPWVEDKDGYGIGETITLSFDRPVHILYFSNGFVSFDKPYLYSDNSRVKQIEMENLDDHTLTTIDISDTPNVQEIRFDGAMQNILIRITDVYPGDRWDDTCINFIVGESWDNFY